MNEQSATASDQTRLSSSRASRDYHLSLALLVTGIVLVVAFYGFVYWAMGSGNYPTSPARDFEIGLVGDVGYTIIIVGAIFAGINRSLLRVGRRTA